MSAEAKSNIPATNAGPREVRIVSHSMLFYWWPVWVFGLLMAGLTFLDGHRLAIVPPETKVLEDKTIPGLDGPRTELVLPADGKLPVDSVTGKSMEPVLRVAARSSYGVVFVVVLLLVIFITNVPIRGMGSVVAIIILVSLTIILTLADLWDSILEMVVHSRIFINAFGYLGISVPLLVLWLVTVLFFDNRTYMVFTPGQLRVHQEIGGGEVAYDTMGMVVEKRRSDLFRHWILGIGSGDLIVKTAGANAQQFQMPNVLFVGSKIQMIQQMLQQREVVRG
jgi:hypothetical protein